VNETDESGEETGKYNPEVANPKVVIADVSSSIIKIHSFENLWSNH
jgi:hypothetical protein